MKNVLEVVPSWPSSPCQSVRRLALRRAADEPPPPSPRLSAIDRLAAPPKPRPPRRSRAPVVATPVRPDRSQNRAPRTLRDGVGALLGVFLAATLVMVTAVIVVGSVDRLWILAPVMLVDFATTFGVVTYIMRLLADDGESPA